MDLGQVTAALFSPHRIFSIVHFKRANMLKYERHLSFGTVYAIYSYARTLNNMYDGLDVVVFNLFVLSRIRLCAYPYHCRYVVFLENIFIYTLHTGCLDSYYGQCRLEAFAVPMFCFLLQNTTEAKSY
jgi:hypothetical protein